MMIKRACKYFCKVRKQYIYCEAARIRPGDIAARNAYLAKFCNREDCDNKCPMKQTLDEFYGAEN